MDGRINRCEKQIDFQSNFNFSRAVKLVEMIKRHFNNDELNGLMMGLTINHEEIESNSYSERVREFVHYCERRSLINPLILLCQEERPLAKWPY